LLVHIVPGSYHFSLRGESKRDAIHRVKYWELVADNLSKARWSWGWVSAVDRQGRTLWIADAHRGDLVGQGGSQDLGTVMGPDGLG
jgi:hypothetical protein